MSGVQEAIDTLRSALLEKGVESHARDAFDHLASCLNSSSPSVQMIQKLCAVLRQPFLPLYNACLQPALHLSSTVLSTVLAKICDAHNLGDEKLRSAWDATGEVILSGVLDFLDQKDSDNTRSDATVWEGLYRNICEFFFPDSRGGLPVLSISLCLSAYNTLTEVASSQIAVVNALHHKDIMGGERLGAAISRTREYLLLEALLMLFARLLPPTHNTSQGKVRRLKFVKEVLGSPKLFKCSAELLDIMQKASGTQWDDVAAQLIDALAKNDITYPQPFSIDEIDVCGQVFPQPLATDRLIMDKDAFLANIVADDNEPCESLRVPYSYIRTITLDTSGGNIPRGKVSIMVYLTSPPLVANTKLRTSDENLHARFLLQDNTVGTFMEALRRRGVSKLRFLNPLARVQKKRKTISIGSGLKLANDSSPPPIASFEGKVQHVNQVYETDAKEPEGPIVGDRAALPPLDPKPELLEYAALEVAPETQRISRLTSPTKRTSDATLPFSSGDSIVAVQLFGGSDELSEISEPESDMADKRLAGASGFGNHKPTRHKIDRVQASGSSGANSVVGNQKNSKSTSKADGWTEGASPISGLLPDGRVDISSMPLSNADTFGTRPGADDIGDQPAVRQDFVHVDNLQKRVVNECGPSDAENDINSAAQPQAVVCFAGDEHGQDIGPFVPSSGYNQNTRSVEELTQDNGFATKVAGTRRKRETIKSSSKVITEVDDEFARPQKKRRDGKSATRTNKAKNNEAAIVNAKACSKPVKSSPPGAHLTMADFGGPPELKPTCQGTRKSTRIKKKTVRTRANSMHGKTQKGNQTDDTNLKVRHGHETTINFNSRPKPALVVELLRPTFNDEVSTSAEAMSTETSLPQDVLKSRPSTAPIEKRPPLDLAALDSMEPQEQFQIIPEKTMDDRDQQPTSDSHIAAGGVGRVQAAAADAFSFKENQNLVMPLRPIVEPTPRAEIVTIDLTIDSSPVRGVNESHETSVAVASEADRQMKFGTPDRPSCVVVKESTISLSPQCRRRNVTFASPIGCVLDKRVDFDPQLMQQPPIDTLRRRRSPSPTEGNILSPLDIPIQPPHIKHEPSDRIIPQLTLQKPKISQASTHDRITNEGEIQDIVEILNEIQAVIIKGISNRFRNVEKHMQHGRDQLIQQVREELQGMVIENAKYFNQLVHLEEDYCKHGKTVTRCWEELIDCNDGIAVEFRNVLTEHDQNISAKIFPKSLLPLKPVSLCRRANA